MTGGSGAPQSGFDRALDQARGGRNDTIGVGEVDAIVVSAVQRDVLQSQQRFQRRSVPFHTAADIVSADGARAYQRTAVARRSNDDGSRGKDRGSSRTAQGNGRNRREGFKTRRGGSAGWH